MIVTGATVVCLLLLVRVTEVKADYVFEVQVDSFQNPTGQCLDCRVTPSDPAGCCDDFRDFDCPSAPADLCDTYFIFCLREFGTSGDNDTFCPLGRQETPGTITDMSIELLTFQPGVTALIGLPNPLFFSVPGDWPGRVQLLLVVMDRDPPTANNFFDPNCVDEVVSRFLIQERLVISVGTEFTAPELFESMFADISLRFRVTCADGFNGPNCEIVVDCGSLTRPMNGQVTVTSTTLDSTATYSCDQGYDLMGVSMRICQTSGQWSDQPPVCTPVDCGNLTDPENGQVTLSGTTLDSSANYSCNNGYNLVGTSTRICLSNGTWSDQPPICTSVTPNPVVSSTPVTLSSSVNEVISTSTSQFVEGSSTEPPSPTSSVRPVSETPTPQAPTEGPTDTMIPPTSAIAIPVPTPSLSLVDSRTSGEDSQVICGDDSQGSTVLYITVGAVGGLVGGLVAALSTSILVLIVVILVCVKRKQSTAHHNMTGNEAANGTAAHNIIAVSEEVYCTVDELRDEDTTSQNEACGTAAHNIIALSENEAYSTAN